jgi:hypothetical protein
MRHHGGAYLISSQLECTLYTRWYYSTQKWSIFHVNLLADFSPIVTPRAIFMEYNADIRPPQYY